ncbi:uncharacterized protein [Parasteatoda tepidariorum]|uniref:uncharacterized protein n=1 Tax=Parasteatoda tepidariorum TaxID=114398 RepID=UPI001C722ECE|nr:secreted RxLR effector protein 161-like [Parasteatoda tepidariorum]
MSGRKLKKHRTKFHTGSLLYLACGTRPDIAYSSTYMSQFKERPSENHWPSVKHLFKYLKHTKHLCLTYRKTRKKIEVFSDADRAADCIGRKSFSDYVVILGGAAVSWSSKKQHCTALSSAEAEYLAMTHATKEVLWIKSLLFELGKEMFVPPPILINVDNQAAMFIAKNQTTSDWSNHIHLMDNFICDNVVQKIFEFQYINSRDNVADH